MSPKQEQALRRLASAMGERTGVFPDLDAPLDETAGEALDLLFDLGINSRTLSIAGTAKTYPVIVSPRQRTNRLICGCKSATTGHVCYHSLTALHRLVEDPSDPLADEDVFKGFAEAAERDLRDGAFVREPGDNNPAFGVA